MSEGIRIVGPGERTRGILWLAVILKFKYSYDYCVCVCTGLYANLLSNQSRLLSLCMQSSDDPLYEVEFGGPRCSLLNIDLQNPNIWWHDHAHVCASVCQLVGFSVGSIDKKV